MANENTIAIRITVKDDGSVVLKQFGDNAEKAMGTTGKTTESAGKAFAGLAGQLKTFAAVAGIAFGVNEMVSYARESIMLAARVETLGAVLGVVGENAGYSRGEMQQYVNEVKKMGITTEAAHDAVVKIAQAQINAADSAKLARVAQDAAVIGNINSSEAFSRMINGIRSGEVEILKTIGLQVNFESAYKKTAAALGKSSDALTEREKAQARANVVMEAGTRIEGAYEASMTKAGKAMLSLSRLSEELKLGFGELFGPALTSSVFAITDVLKAWNKEMEEAKASGQWDEMTDMISGPLKVAWIDITNLTETVLGFIRPMGPMAGDIASGAAGIAYGFGYVLAALKPVGEFLGNSIALTWEFAKILGQTVVMTTALATGQVAIAQTAWGEAKKSASQVEALSQKNRALLTSGIADAVAGYGRQAEAAVTPPKRQTEAEKIAAEAISKTRATANAAANKARDNQEKLDKKAADKRAKVEEDLTKELNKTIAARKKHEGSFYDYKAAEIEVDLQKFRTAGATEEQIARLRKEKLINLSIEAAEKREETEAKLYNTISKYSDESVAAEIAALNKKYKEEARYTDDVALLAAAREKEEEAIYSRREKAILDYYQQAGRYGQDYNDLVESLAIDEYNRVMDLLDDEEEAERAYTEFKQKQSISRVESEKKAALDRLVAQQALMKDLQGFEGQYYAVSEKLIREKAVTELAILNKGLTDYSEIEKNKRLVAEATTLKLKQLDIEKGKSSDDFIAGMSAKIDEIQLKQIKWGRTGYEVMDTMSSSMASTFSTVFKDRYQGEMQSIGDYSTMVWDSVRNKFFDMTGQMLAENTIELLFKTSWTQDGATVLSTINKVLGLADSLDLGQYLGVNFALGGPVPGYASYPGNDIRNDKVPAWLSPGEYVMPRTAVNADTREILDYIRCFGRAPGYAMGGWVDKWMPWGINDPNTGDPLGDWTQVPHRLGNELPYWAFVAGVASGEYGPGGYEIHYQRAGNVDAYTHVVNPDKTISTSLKQWGSGLKGDAGGGLGGFFGFLNQSIGPLVPTAIMAAAAAVANYALPVVGPALLSGMITYGQTDSFLDAAKVAAIKAATAYAAQYLSGTMDSIELGGQAFSPEEYFQNINADISTIKEMARITGTELSEWSVLSDIGKSVGKSVLVQALQTASTGGAGGSGMGSLGFSASVNAGGMMSMLSNLNGIIGMNVKIPSAKSGIDYIPRDDYLVNTHKGEAILEADDANQWRSGGGATTVLAELKSLRADIGRMGYYVVKNTNRVAKVVERWDRDGQPAQRVLS